MDAAFGRASAAGGGSAPVAQVKVAIMVARPPAGFGRPAGSRARHIRMLNTPVPPPSSVVVCEIIAPRASHAAVLAEIALACARDLGQALEPRALRIGRRAASRRYGEPGDTDSVLTLRLPVALASSQHKIWCLACRLACFLPSCRVAVLVEAADTFAPSPHSAKTRARRVA